MALNKSNTSPGMKAVLILLIVAFVASFISIGAGFFAPTPGATGTATSADPLAAINTQYQSQVSGITGQLQGDPENYSLLVSLGNTYYDWAAAIQQTAQTNTQVTGADLPMWSSAKDAYARAVKIKDDEPAVRTDYSITLFYTGETNEALKVGEKTIKQSPDFAPAHFNNAVFYRALGQNDKATAAFNRALELDPQGSQVNIEYVKQALEELKSAPASGTAE